MRRTRFGKASPVISPLSRHRHGVTACAARVAERSGRGPAPRSRRALLSSRQIGHLGPDGYDSSRRERRALRLIAVSFFVLASYAVFESARDLVATGDEAGESTIGIVLAALSLMVMPALAVAKRRTADALGSPTLRADSRETLLCAWLSAALLGVSS